jgi:predicted membrane protein
MKKKAQTMFADKKSFWDTIQYLLGVLITLLFALGLIPFTYGDIFGILAGLIIVQFAISLVRFRLLNISLLIVLFILSLLSLIPFVGYIFRFFAILIAILDFASYKHAKVYHRFEQIRVEKTSFKKKTSKKTKEKAEAKDASFKER